MAGIEAIQGSAVPPAVHLPQETVFKGEGFTHRFRQGAEAIAGVRAHEAGNIRRMSRQASENGFEVVDRRIRVTFGIDPETGKPIVTGGRAQIRFRPEDAAPFETSAEQAPQEQRTSLLTTEEATEIADDAQLVSQVLSRREQELAHELQAVELELQQTVQEDEEKVDTGVVVTSNGLVERPADLKKRKASIEQDLEAVRDAKRQVEQKKLQEQQKKLLEDALASLTGTALNVVRANAALKGADSKDNTPKAGLGDGVGLAPFTLGGLAVNLRV